MIFNFRSLALVALLSALLPHSARSQFDLGAIQESIPDACLPAYDGAFTCTLEKLLFGCARILEVADKLGGISLDITCPEIVDISCAIFEACPDCENEYVLLLDCLKTEVAAGGVTVDLPAGVDVNVTETNSTGCDEMVMVNMTAADVNMTAADMNMTDCSGLENATVATVDPELANCELGPQLCLA